MKNGFPMRCLYRPAPVIFFFLLAASVSVSAEEPLPGLPESMKPRWESVRQGLLQEYEVCIEHCGTSRPCLERCQKAYASRLKREYQRMIHAKPETEDAAGTGSCSNEQAKAIEAEWGVRPLNVRLTGSDHFLDFRYRVTDSEKAAAVLSRKEKAFLIHEETEKVFPVPVTKLGPLRATAVEPKSYRNYAILFNNSDKSIKKGDKVTIVIGDFRAEHLTVE